MEHIAAVADIVEDADELATLLLTEYLMSGVEEVKMKTENG